MAQWLDKYPVIDPDHSHMLETQAAFNEFAHKMPRHEAEKAAHDWYRNDQLTDAASHHLVGMHLAHSAGAQDEAKKHGILYALCCRQLGHDPVGEPHPEVAQKAKNLKATKPQYNFRVHPADSLAIAGVATEQKPR